MKSIMAEVLRDNREGITKKGDIVEIVGFVSQGSCPMAIVSNKEKFESIYIENLRKIYRDE